MNVLMIEVMELLHSFMWPFVRVSAVLVSAPIFSTTSLNLPTRIAIGAVLTLLLFPNVAVPDIDPFSFGALEGLFHEVTVGLLMGVSLQVVTAAIILAGQSIAGGMGLGMANMVDPNLGNVPTVSQFLLIICLLVFLSLGGHLILLTILSDSFTYIPIAQGILQGDMLDQFIAWSAQMFVGAAALALPIMMGLLMINVCLGVISRASPALNIFAVGFPALIPLGFGMLIVTLSVLVGRIEGLWFDAFRYLQSALGMTA